MKLKSVIISVLILLFEYSNICAQSVSNGGTDFKLQLGASTPFGLPAGSSLIIPKIGIDLNFGQFGLRTSGEFFKTSPEFDVDEYLSPISSVITQSNVSEKNANILLGIAPYLTFAKKTISFQTGIGLKFLLQKGATATAVYNQTPQTSILNFPNGDANRKLLIIEPNIRASFGKPGSFLRFYAEAGYTIPAGGNEYTFTSRNLTNVIDPRGNINIKTLLESKQVTTTEKSLPAYASVGAGIEINLFSGKGQEKPRASQTEYETPKPKKPKEIINEPDSYEIHEIKPLILLSKGAERPSKKQNTVEFSWLTLNADDCGPLQYEFTISEIKDPKRKEIESDLLMPGLQNQPIYKKMLNEKNLINKGNSSFIHSITKNEMPILFEEGKQFQWQVKALDVTGNFPQCAWGGNNSVMSVYTSYGCGIKVLIDTILCSTNPPISGFANYEMKFRIQNNSDPANCTNNMAIFSGNANYPNGSNIKLTDLTNQLIPGMNFTAVNPLIGLSLPIGQTSNQYSITMTLPSNPGISGIRLHAWPTYVTDPAYGAAFDNKNLPNCGCDFCDSVSFTVGLVKPLLQSIPQSGYDVISIPVSITYSPWPVNRIVAEVVAFEHIVNTPTCITCNTDNRMHGVFVGSAQNHIVGNTTLWLNSGNASLYPSPTTFSREATWSTNSQNGVILNGQVVMLNVGVPIQNTLVCCQDRIRWTIRYSFISKDSTTGECRVCEITRNYCWDRTGAVKPPSIKCNRLPVPIPIDINPIKSK